MKKVIIDICEKDKKRGRKQALKMYPIIGPCVKCGNKKSERHHIDENPLNNAKENIMPLCKKCHCREHDINLTDEARAKGNVIASALKRAKMVCPQGHPYSGYNLIVKRDGARMCRQCNIEAKRRYRKRGGRG